MPRLRIHSSRLLLSGLLLGSGQLLGCAPQLVSVVKEVGPYVPLVYKGQPGAVLTRGATLRQSDVYVHVNEEIPTVLHCTANRTYGDVEMSLKLFDGTGILPACVRDVEERTRSLICVLPKPISYYVEVSLARDSDRAGYHLECETTHLATPISAKNEQTRPPAPQPVVSAGDTRVEQTGPKQVAVQKHVQSHPFRDRKSPVAVKQPTPAAKRIEAPPIKPDEAVPAKVEESPLPKPAVEVPVQDTPAPAPTAKRRSITAKVGEVSRDGEVWLITVSSCGSDNRATGVLGGEGGGVFEIEELTAEGCTLKVVDRSARRPAPGSDLLLLFNKRGGSKSAPSSEEP